MARYVEVENENHEQNVDINVDVFEELFNIKNVYCKHKCAIKVNVVYVVML